MQAPFSRTLPCLLEEMAARQPEAMAVISQGQAYSYAELAQRVRSLATALRGMNIRRGDRVAVLATNGIEWLETVFAALQTGAVVVPISTWSKAGELAFILEDAHIHTLLAPPPSGKDDYTALIGQLLPEASSGDAWQSSRFPDLRNVIIMGTPPYTAPRDMPAPALENGPSAVDDAIILYTSGSTSKPKAVPLAHYGLIENGFAIGERQGLGPDDRVLVSVPLFWAYGAANALPATFTHGAALVLQDRFEPQGALDLIETHRCTALYTLPTMTTALIHHPSFDRARTQSLRRGLTIGTAQDVTNAADMLGATDICNLYGSSETYGNCCVTPHDWSLRRRTLCQGPPLPGVSLRFSDPESGVLLKPGMVGQIEVSGYLMRGYDGQSAALNPSIFTPDGWYRTGDLGRLSPEGDLIFVGRTSDMIKRAGINVSPAEVEDVLMQHTDVAQVGVVGTPDPTRDEIIVAFVVPTEGATPTGSDLIAHCRTIASRYKIPDRIYFRDRLPTTSTGKLLRQSLREEAERLASSCRETTDAA